MKLKYGLLSIEFDAGTPHKTSVETTGKISTSRLLDKNTLVHAYVDLVVFTRIVGTS